MDDWEMTVLATLLAAKRAVFDVARPPVSRPMGIAFAAAVRRACPLAVSTDFLAVVIVSSVAALHETHETQ